MRNLKLSWAFFAIILVIASCKRDFNLPEEATNKSNSNIEAKDLVVPSGFKFETEKTLNVNVKVADAKANERYTIKIYSDLPTTGKLISTGLTNAKAEYSTTVRIPAWIEYIYIEKINPNGSSKYEKVKANQFAKAIFNNTSSPYIIRKAGSGMSCTSRPCSFSHTNPSGSITVFDDQTVCVSGNSIGNVNITVYGYGVLQLTGTITGSVNLTVETGGIAVICASGNFNNITINGEGKVYILENTTITINTLAMAGPIAEFKNWSDNLHIVNPSTPSNASIYNAGKMYFDDGVATNYCTIINDGELYFDYLTVSSDDNTITNNNYLSVNGTFSLSPNSTLTNNCHLNIGGGLDNEGTIINKSYIKANTFIQNKTEISYIEQQDGALLSVDHLSVAIGKIKGTGTNRSIIKVAYTTNFYYWYTDRPIVEGLTDICDVDGIELNEGTFTSPAAISCAGSIPTSTCNPEGFGTSTITDSDNDGVADAQDEYPNDATRAFNSYYPNASATATIAFEDLWPAQADYDFNDLSVALNIQKVLNADNKVVECKVKMNVRAVGASFDNGFGFQLDDLVPADISSITGQVLVRNLITRNANNTEAGQTKAVIIGFDSPEPTLHRAAGSFFNTIKTNGVGTSDTVTLNIVFTAPIDDSKLTLEKINPFMFTNRRRGYEVHLMDFKPTSLATTSLFGTFADRSNPSNNSYYKNANGMPWAILIPTDFYHPAEKKAITTAYNFFADWVISGGTTNTNWYTNTVGNQNTENIY